jgi:hypothetical protein
MRRSREEILDWEARWRMPTAVATIGGALLFIGSLVAISGLGGDGSAEFLTDAHAHGSKILLSGTLQALAFLGLGVGLVYLFRAAEGRSERVRPQLIGLFVAAPLFLALASGLTPVITNEAADKFVAGEAEPSLTRSEAAEECREDRQDEGAEDFGKEHDAGPSPLADCTETKLEDDAAEEALSDVGLRQVSSGLQLAGILGLVFALLYGCLNAMRVGLLTRFWGSLGMALGVAALLSLVPFTVLWFLYFGLLVAGFVPGGRPPAWATGEAIPWPTPGEKVAAELETPAEPSDPEGPRRKRKQRDDQLGGPE